MTSASQAFDAHAHEYDAARRRLVPCSDELYGTAVEAVGLAGEVSAVLDLGAGTGLMAAAVLTAHPHAAVTLLDGAPAMLEQARARLGTAARYLVADLSDPLPDGPWDAIVSALAIHHLEDEAKRDLFGRIATALRPGGVFVNAEVVAGGGPRFERVNFAWQRDAARAAGSDDHEWHGAVERMTHDRCATVSDQLSWLRAAGFAEADCVFKHHCFATLVALT